MNKKVYIYIACGIIGLLSVLIILLSFSIGNRNQMTSNNQFGFDTADIEEHVSSVDSHTKKSAGAPDGFPIASLNPIDNHDTINDQKIDTAIQLFEEKEFEEAYLVLRELYEGAEREQIYDYYWYCAGMLYKDYRCYGSAIDAFGLSDIDGSSEERQKIIDYVSVYNGSWYGKLSTFPGVYAWLFIKDGKTYFTYESTYTPNSPVSYFESLIEYDLTDNSGETGFAIGGYLSLDDILEKGVVYEDMDYWFMVKGNEMIIGNCGEYTTFSGSYTRTGPPPAAE